MVMLALALWRRCLTKVKNAGWMHTGAYGCILSIRYQDIYNVILYIQHLVYILYMLYMLILRYLQCH